VSTPERDEHFRDFAKQQFDDVDAMFNRLFIARDDCDQAGETEATNDIQLYLARRAYDLAYHVLHSFELMDLETCESRDELLINIPDMTELPEERQ